MFCVDEMRTCIQEWMGQTLSPTELARTYAAIKTELERQLEVCMDIMTDKEM